MAKQEMNAEDIAKVLESVGGRYADLDLDKKSNDSRSHFERSISLFPDTDFDRYNSSACNYASIETDDRDHSHPSVLGSEYESHQRGTTLSFRVDGDGNSEKLRKELQERADEFSKRMGEMKKKYEQMGVKMSVDIDNTMRERCGYVFGKLSVSMKTETSTTISLDDKINATRELNKNICDEYNTGIRQAMTALAEDIKARKSVAVAITDEPNIEETNDKNKDFSR